MRDISSKIPKDWYLTNGGTTPLCVSQMRKDWYDAAFPLIQAQGSDAWAIALKGA